MRRLFPALADTLVRLDGPAGSQTPHPVLDAIMGYLRTSNANLGGAFPHSIATAQLVAEARRRAAAFFGADPAEVGFGLNATAINHTLSRAATRHLRPGDEIVLTALDHDANVAPWVQAAADHDLVIRTVGVRADTRLDLAALADTIGPLLGSAVTCTSWPAATSSCARWSTIVDLPAPLGPSTEMNKPRGCSEKGRSFISAPF